MLRTDKAPAAIGPTRRASLRTAFSLPRVRSRSIQDQAKWSTGDVVAQTERVMENLRAFSHRRVQSWGDVVKTTVFLHDIAHFPTVNEIYARWIGDARPARSTVQVSGLPRGALVEIDAVAVAPIIQLDTANE